MCVYSSYIIIFLGRCDEGDVCLNEVEIRCLLKNTELISNALIADFTRFFFNKIFEEKRL